MRMLSANLNKNKLPVLFSTNSTVVLAYRSMLFSPSTPSISAATCWNFRGWKLSQLVVLPNNQGALPGRTNGGLVGGVSTSSVGLYHQRRDVPPA